MYATNSTGTWVIRNIDTEGEAGRYSSIAIDSNDKVHISYCCGSCYHLRYATNAGGSWTVPCYPENSGVNGHTSIKLDKNNKAHISYQAGTTLKYTNNTSGSWNKVVVDDRSSTGMYSSLEINSAGAVIISYFDGVNSDLDLAVKSSKPSAPTLVAATPGDKKVTLNWTEPSTDGGSAITNYTVYRGISEGNETILTTLGKTLSYVDLSVSNGNTYFYKVAAVNGAGEGPRSNSIKATPAIKPEAPRNLSCSYGNKFVQLNWEVPSSNGGSTITNYSVWRGMTNDTKSQLVQLGPVLTFNDTAVVNGETYYYIVMAINIIGSNVTIQIRSLQIQQQSPRHPQG